MLKLKLAYWCEKS